MLACGLEFYQGGEFLAFFHPEATAARKQTMKCAVHMLYLQQNQCSYTTNQPMAQLWTVDYSGTTVPGMKHWFYHFKALYKSISPLQECCGSNGSANLLLALNFQHIWRKSRFWILLELMCVKKSPWNLWTRKEIHWEGSGVAVFSRKDGRKWTNTSTRSGERNTSFWEDD